MISIWITIVCFVISFQYWNFYEIVNNNVLNAFFNTKSFFYRLIKRYRSIQKFSNQSKLMNQKCCCNNFFVSKRFWNFDVIHVFVNLHFDSFIDFARNVFKKKFNLFLMYCFNCVEFLKNVSFVNIKKMITSINQMSIVCVYVSSFVSFKSFNSSILKITNAKMSICVCSVVNFFVVRLLISKSAILIHHFDFFSTIKMFYAYMSIN